MRNPEHFHITPTGDTQRLEVLHLEPEDLKPHAHRRTVHDLDSFMRYTENHTDASKAAIYWNAGGVVTLFDELAEKTNRVRFDFTRPIVARRWIPMIEGKRLPHKPFREFLEKNHLWIVDGVDFLQKIARLQLSQTVTYDGQLDDDQNFKVAFTSESGGDVAKLPKKVTIQIPLIEGLAKDFPIQLDFHLEVPKSEDGKPIFWFTCDTLEDTLKEAAAAAIAEVQKALPNHLIVQGDLP